MENRLTLGHSEYDVLATQLIQWKREKKIWKKSVFQDICMSFCEEKNV